MPRLPLLCALLLVAAAPSCASSGYRRAGRTAERTEDYRDDLVRLEEQVGLASEALRALSENPGDSPRSNRETFETYAREVENLQAAVERSREAYGRMDGRAEEFFGGWNADAALIADVELKRSADERRASLEAGYETLARGHDELAVALAEHVRALEDLRLYLEHDLTAAGIASARTSIERAFARGAELERRLGAHARATEDASASLAPLRAQAEVVPAHAARVR